jgi:hypothetical protein
MMNSSKQTAWDSNWPSVEDLDRLDRADAAERLPWCNQILTTQLTTYQRAAQAAEINLRIVAHEGSWFTHHVYAERKVVQPDHIAVELTKEGHANNRGQCDLSQFWHYVHHPAEAEAKIKDDTNLEWSGDHFAWDR